MKRTSFLILVALGAQALWVGNAMALDPETSTQVSAKDFVTLSNRDSIDADGTAYLGVDECIDAINDDGNVVVKFTTTLDLNQVDLNGEPYFQGAYSFDVDRDSTSSVTCSDTTCEEIDEDDVTIGTTSVEITVSFTKLTGLTDPADCQNDLDKEYFIRLTFDNGSTTSSLEEADIRLIIDTKRPSAPESFTATVTESAAAISWVDDSPAEDRAGYAIYFSSSPIAGGLVPAETPNVTLAGTVNVPEDSSLTSGSVDRSFEANSTIYVSVATVDNAGNFSTLLPSATTTVLDTVDFWEAYKASGGEEEGGYCAQGRSNAPAGAGGFAAVMMVGMLALRRRRRDQNNAL